MASRRTTFEKTQRARSKKAKADLKRAKRMGRLEDIEIPEAPRGMMDGDTEVVDEDAPDTSDWLPKGTLDAGKLMTLVERCHKDYDDGTIDFEEFEERKLILMEKLSVD